MVCQAYPVHPTRRTAGRTVG